MSLLNTLVCEFQKDAFVISTDKSKLDIKLIHDYLSNHSYWAENIPREIVERSIQNSLCFGLYHHNRQIGFARVTTDFATFGYLADVFILEEYRSQGLSKWLMECILEKTPELQGFRRWSLATADAHGLYEQFGFTALARPERMMEKVGFTKYS
ncbi:GNAT family N-acetyltransferase [Runella slithyformis]|uniref:GCN5-related N-acetyltransferase n=1 Tax=Runella slithyformis (strain ATCC 29530 / DSM 19594 / LMG 11500 / NCIMB 11436 / LSU 4) TaxID=761193 RepID=A0A7U4E5V8_RUNSL|nr:GNAT family N-acetyltransferase [Runella slithyformis]AEI48598.1 GCN5-related N-acetyltransferase [Runella slithyformis DSM 19594]